MYESLAPLDFCRKPDIYFDCPLTNRIGLRRQSGHGFKSFCFFATLAPKYSYIIYRSASDMMKCEEVNYE